MYLFTTIHQHSHAVTTPISLIASSDKKDLVVLQDGVLVQARGRGGEASTSGKEAGGKSSVAYVGADPIDAQLLKPKVLTDGVLLPSTSSR